MGSEAISKVARRDIRRAYAPEASEEVLKFVDTVKADLDQRLARAHEVDAVLTDRLDTADRRLDRMFTFIQLPFRQRLRWLVTGTWDQ